MRALLAIGLLSLATACAEFSPDAGMSTVTSAVRDKVGGETVKITSAADAERVRARVDALLGEPLTPDVAVQVALLNNRNLQAAYNDLGLSEIAGVEASLPPNPKLSLSRLARSGVVEWEFQLLGNILALATLPARKEIARQRFAQAQQVAIESTYRLALETRRAWVNAVAAQQVVAYLEQSRMAADATSDLLRKLGETGGATKFEQARAAAAYAELSAQLAHARMRARQDREALLRLLGLWDGAQDIRLPAQLPALPPRLESIDNIETEAIRNRVDVTIARQELSILAKSIDLAEATRFISLLELSGIVDTERDDDGRKTRGGFELELEIPIFDGGQVKLRRERESYMRAVNRLAARAAAARSEARSAYQTLARNLRHRALLPDPHPAVAAANLFGGPAALQRHAGRCVRSPRRGTRPHLCQCRGVECAARFPPRHRGTAGSVDCRRNGAALRRHQHDAAPRNPAARPLIQE
jgi:outer membrane protein TolC